ncbi:hypothetical protein AVEN_153552-1 [Araneus ventricosus]|uniref:Uncharacterized protein n=1 Tax=Araneus ventricosus TaxID=182803 RepID=A0A4Y2G708_ARAVE|nr:hypothetical protein AVEN_153552-1 [Araneus ventricosus]
MGGYRVDEYSHFHQRALRSHANVIPRTTLNSPLPNDLIHSYTGAITVQQRNPRLPLLNDFTPESSSDLLTGATELCRWVSASGSKTRDPIPLKIPCEYEPGPKVGQVPFRWCGMEVGECDASSDDANLRRTTCVSPAFPSIDLTSLRGPSGAIGLSVSSVLEPAHFQKKDIGKGGFPCQFQGPTIQGSADKKLSNQVCSIQWGQGLGALRYHVAT